MHIVEGQQDGRGVGIENCRPVDLRSPMPPELDGPIRQCEQILVVVFRVLPPAMPTSNALRIQKHRHHQSAKQFAEEVFSSLAQASLFRLIACH
jgi:hypothetical protein